MRKKSADTIVIPEELVIDENAVPDNIRYGASNLTPGRTPKALQLQKYEHVLKRLDGCIDDVLDELIRMIHDPDPNIRLRVCEMILKRYIPEKKVKEIVGADGGPVQVQQNVDMRTAVLTVVGVLDEMGLDEIRERSADGSFRILDINPGTEG